MTRPKKRLRKKYFRKLNWEICYYVSQADVWRKKLFEAREGEVFDIPDSDLRSILPVSYMAKIRKYRLQFSVEVLSKQNDSHKTQEYFCVTLLFMAKDFPKIVDSSMIARKSS